MIPLDLYQPMSYVYVLQSLQDNRFYTGWTTDLKRRLRQHNDGETFSTRSRRPLRLVYYEAYLSSKDAKRREKYLKTGMGKCDLRRRLSSSLANLGGLTG